MRGNIVSLIIILLIIANVYTASKKGVVYTLAPLLGYIAAAVLCKPISYLISPFAKAPIQSGIKRFFTIIVPGNMLSDIMLSASEQLADALCLLLAFTMIRIVCYCIIQQLSAVEHLPGINHIGKLIAGIYGCLKVVVAVWIISIVLNFFAPIAPDVQAFIRLWYSSGIVSFFEHFNLFQKLLNMYF